MVKVRALVAVIGCGLMAVGYLASQVAYANGEAAEYAQKVDSPQVALLAFVLFLTAVVLFFIPNEKGDPS